MNELTEYVKKILPTPLMWVIASATLAIAVSATTLPTYLQTIWPKLKIPNILLFQASLLFTTLFLGLFVLLVLTLRHIKKLNIKLEKYQPVPSKTDISNRLKGVEEKILVLVSQNEQFSDSQISKLSNTKKQLATLHLHELKDINFISPTSRLDENDHMIDVWSIEQLGRKYLSHHGLL